MQHFFTDSEAPEFNATAAKLAWQRSSRFVGRL
jgi:dienelactone hydrolase